MLATEVGGPYLGGNYWSDYVGEDLNGDGLGDMLLPYNSSGNIQNGGDYLPLVRALEPPHAHFSLDKNFGIGTENDSITSGTYDANLGYHMDIYNEDDESDTVLDNLTFSIQAENITDVDWEEYADLNESYAEWRFPPKFVVEENEGFGTGVDTTYSEPKYLNLNIPRWFNQTLFNETAYQLVNFSIEFKDKNFEWLWGNINANEHEEVYASIVLGTFNYEAPLDGFEEWDHGIHFDFDEELIQPGNTYNFSVVIKVEFTGKEAPPILYKPRFEIGKGLYYNSTTGDGHKIEIPAEMLPDNVSYASVSTNESNAWLIKRHNHTIAGLEEVSELVGSHAIFFVAKVFHVVTENDTIHSGTYERNLGCELNIKNSDDTSDAALGDLGFSAQADNITAVSWEEYAEWNETSVEWTFPSEDFVIDENDWFGHGFRTNHTGVRHLNVDISREMNQTRFKDSAFQLANFTVTFEGMDFQWCGGRIEANEHYEVNASIVPDSFESDAPLDWVNEWEHGVHFGFDRDAIETDIAYNFSALIKVDLTGNRAPPIVYKPEFFINVELEKSFAPGGEGFTAEMPPEMLPSYVNNASVTTNISNNWMLRQVNRSIAKLEEVYGPTRIEAVLLNIYWSPLPVMPNVTFSSGVHESYKVTLNGLHNPTSTSVLSPSILLETQKPFIDYGAERTKDFSYNFISEDSSEFYWSLYEVPPHEKGTESMVILSEMELKDHGYSASVSVDQFEFTAPSEQNLNITVDVYNNSGMECLQIEAWPSDHSPILPDFVSAEFVDWSSDITPEYFDASYTNWMIQNPGEKTYMFSIKVNVTPNLPCAYKPIVDVGKRDHIDETLFNSSSKIAENMWAGNYTISTSEVYDWIEYKNVASSQWHVSSFPAIAAENYTTISGYVKDDNGNPIKNTGVFVNIWNESKSEYQDYVETSTNESGYYKAYVKSNEKYKIVAGWIRPDYTTEEVENITILPRIENFTLHNASVVCGGVFDKNKKPMQGVEVMVVNESNITISSDFTNEDGYYRQLKIPEYGNYTVKVEGYDSNELELSDIGKGKAVLHNFVVELPPIFNTGQSKNPYPKYHGNAQRHNHTFP